MSLLRPGAAMAALLIAGAAAAAGPTGGPTGPGDTGADAGTDAGVRPAQSKIDGILPPLGRIGDVVQPVPPGGLPGGELVVTARFPGCGEAQAIYLSRFVWMGAARAGEQIQKWLQSQPGLERRLFGKAPRLAQALAKARASTPHEGVACRKEKGRWVHLDLLSDDGRLEVREAPAAVCKLERADVASGGVRLFTTPTKGRVTKRSFGAAVGLLPARPGEDACRPRLSAVLFDDAGAARLRYHADFNGALEVDLVGDRCQIVRFRFDETHHRFVPERVRDPACPHP